MLKVFFMHIIVNTRLLLKNKLEGIGWYTFETLKRICKAQPQHQFTFLFDRKYDPSFIFSDNIQAKIIGIPARHPFLWYLWFQFSVKKYLSKTKHDLFLSPDGFLPLNIKSKSLAVIHDINFVHFPKHFLFFQEYTTPVFFQNLQNKPHELSAFQIFHEETLALHYKSMKLKLDLATMGLTPFTKQFQKLKKKKSNKTLVRARIISFLSAPLTQEKILKGCFWHSKCSKTTLRQK